MYIDYKNVEFFIASSPNPNAYNIVNMDTKDILEVGLNFEPVNKGRLDSMHPEEFFKSFELRGLPIEPLDIEGAPEDYTIEQLIEDEIEAAFFMRRRSNFILSSGSKEVIPADKAERRYIVDSEWNEIVKSYQAQATKEALKQAGLNSPAGLGKGIVEPKQERFDFEKHIQMKGDKLFNTSNLDIRASFYYKGKCVNIYYLLKDSLISWDISFPWESIVFEPINQPENSYVYKKPKSKLSLADRICAGYVPKIYISKLSLADRIQEIIDNELPEVLKGCGNLTVSFSSPREREAFEEIEGKFPLIIHSYEDDPDLVEGTIGFAEGALSNTFVTIL